MIRTNKTRIDSIRKAVNATRTFHNKIHAYLRSPFDNGKRMWLYKLEQITTKVNGLLPHRRDSNVSPYARVWAYHEFKTRDG